jgi:hypothetical protein
MIMGLPTNIVDLISSIKDNGAGIFEYAQIGDLIIDLLVGLSGVDTYDVTDKPVQSGFDVTLAAIKKPRERVLVVRLTNPEISIEAGAAALITGSAGSFFDTWRDKKDKLYEKFDNREILELTTHEGYYPSCIISSIEPLYDVNENLDCFYAQITIKEYLQVGETEISLTDAAKRAAGKKQVGKL